MLKFDANKIIEPIVNNPMTELESASTDFITDNFFGNKTYRYNFYWLISKLFEKYIKIIFTEELEVYIPHIFLIFKGGNIIKAVIDKTENNIIKSIISVDKQNEINDLKTEYSLTEYNTTKRSDSDFSVYIDFNKIGNMVSKNENKKLVFMKILISAENVCYNILDEIRKKFNNENGTFNLGEGNSNNNSDDYKLPISNLFENIDKLETLNKSYNNKFLEVINKNVDYYNQLQTDPNNEMIKDYINNPKNIVIGIIKIYESSQLEFSKKLNFDSPVLFNNTIPMPKIIGFHINEKFNYNVKDVKPENIINFDKLLKYLNNKKGYNPSKEKHSIYKKDMEIYFTNEQNISLISNDFDMNNIKKNNINNKFTGYSINNVDFDNYFLFNNIKNLTFNDFRKYKISNVNVKQFENNNALYISSNRTLRFIKNNYITAFNLIRSKHNFNVYFELPYTITQINNQPANIRYISIDIPGEFIDISIPTYVDNNLLTCMSNFDKYISSRLMTIDLPNGLNYSHKIYTYSNYGLIHDIEFILYVSTNNTPWKDNKYSKRLERLFRLYYAEIKDNLTINNDIKNQLVYIEDSFNLIKNKFNDILVSKRKEILHIIRNNINIIYEVIKIIDKFINEIKKTNLNIFKMMFDSILGPIVNTINNYKVENIENVILYIDDIIKYYKIFVNNISLPFQGNLNEIQLGGSQNYYKYKYIKYKQKYLNLNFKNYK